MAEEITIPGTNTKVPQWALLAVVAVVVVWLILRNRGDGGQVDTSGALAEEYNQRLQDLYNQTQNTLQEQQQGTTQETPLKPPGMGLGSPGSLPTHAGSGNPVFPPVVISPRNPPTGPNANPNQPTHAGSLPGSPLSPSYPGGVTVSGIEDVNSAIGSHRKAVLQHEKLMAGQTIPKLPAPQRRHREEVIERNKRPSTSIKPKPRAAVAPAAAQATIRLKNPVSQPKRYPKQRAI